MVRSLDTVQGDHDLFSNSPPQHRVCVFPGAGQRLRKICSERILADPDTYCEPVLGKPNAEYASWILNPFNWGGEVELGILSHHFDMEICVVSMEVVERLLWS